MKSRLFQALFCVFAMAITVAAMAQEASAPADPLDSEGEIEETWDTYKVKAYTIQVYGGMFSGDRYLDLPVMGQQTQVEEGTQRVMSYDGTWWDLDELNYNIYDGPIKTIEDGSTAGLRVGTYLADNFHMDLSLSFTKTEAVLTMVNKEDRNNLFREEIDRDPDVQILRGSLKMMYDLDSFDLLGVSPYLGFGFGGVITRYSNLEDVGGLFLVGTAGLRREIVGSTSAFVQFDMTTYAMSRDELNYSKTVTFTDIAAGLSFFVDVVPADVRSRHAADLAERRRR
ncbi:MAG: hypothetical protein R3D98_13950 [Candidatus Krumholzibacteriia bacterium]